MKKSDVLKLVAGIGLGFVPGGEQLQKGIAALQHRDTDPSNDIEEIADAITQVAMGALAAAEGITGEDLLNDPVLAQLAANIKGSITLAHQLIVAKKKA